MALAPADALMLAYNMGMEIRHGTDSAYKNYGCRCESCKSAHREAANDRNRRIREERLAGVTELKSRVRRVPCEGSSTLSGSKMGTGQRGRPPTGLVDKPKANGTEQCDTPREPGECELAVIVETDAISAAEQRPGMVSAAIRMARILDNEALVALHPTTSRQLTGILETLRAQSIGKRRGRLATVQKMTQRRASIS